MSRHEEEQRREFEVNAAKFQIMAEQPVNESRAYILTRRIGALSTDLRQNPALIAGLRRDLARINKAIRAAQLWDAELEQELQSLRDW